MGHWRLERETVLSLLRAQTFYTAKTRSGPQRPYAKSNGIRRYQRDPVQIRPRLDVVSFTVLVNGPQPGEANETARVHQPPQRRDGWVAGRRDRPAGGQDRSNRLPVDRPGRRFWLA